MNIREALLSSIRPQSKYINGMEDDEGSIEVGKVIEVDNDSEGLKCHPCFKSSEEAKLSRSIESRNSPRKRKSTSICSHISRIDHGAHFVSWAKVYQDSIEK